MNFEKWIEIAEIKENIEVNRETVRSIYITPNNVTIIENTVVPFNFLKKSYDYYWIRLTLTDTPENNVLVNSYGGKLEQEFYGEDGQMFPYFENFKNAYDFAMREKQNIIDRFIQNN